MNVPYAITEIEFSDEAKKKIIEEIQKFGDSAETGGVLVGYIETNRIKVELASGPGPNATHSKIFFQADPDYINMFIDLQHADSNGKLNYVAEWHTHPQTYPEPSDYDLNSITEICESSGSFSALIIFGATDFDTSKLLIKSFAVIKFAMSAKFYRLEVVN